MKFIKWFFLAVVISIAASGCTASKPPPPTKSEITAIEKSFMEYVDFETTKLFKAKFNIGSQLIEHKSAMPPTKYIFSDPNGRPNYTNLVWFPTTRPKTKECSLDEGWTIDCIVTYSSKENATCHITETLIDKNGKPRRFPNLESFYRSDKSPRFKFDCYLEKDFKERTNPKLFNVFFMEKPEKVDSDVISITKAILQNHSCDYPDFRVARVDKIPNYGYMIVTDTLSNPGEASDVAPYWIRLNLEPEFDNYALSSGIGWETFFGCEASSSGRNYISNTGDSINRTLPYIN